MRTRSGNRLRLSLKTADSIILALRLLAEFTGISAPYEAPTEAEIHIKTAEVDVQTAVQQIITYLENNKLI